LRIHDDRDKNDHGLQYLLRVKRDAGQVGDVLENTHDRPLTTATVTAPDSHMRPVEGWPELMRDIKMTFGGTDDCTVQYVTAFSLIPEAITASSFPPIA